MQDGLYEPLTGNGAKGLIPWEYETPKLTYLMSMCCKHRELFHAVDERGVRRLMGQAVRSLKRFLARLETSPSKKARK